MRVSCSWRFFAQRFVFVRCFGHRRRRGLGRSFGAREQLVERVHHVVRLDDGRSRARVRPRGLLRLARLKHVHDAVHRPLRRLLPHFLGLFFFHQSQRDLHQIAHHGVDVAPDVADLGELGRLHLHERRVREHGEPPRDLGFADAGRPDHQDILRDDILAHLGRQQAPPVAVAQRDRDRALRGRLPDDIFIQFRDDFARRQIFHGRSCL